MAKKVYIGVGSKARKVKKIYFGVGGKARKVKKAYIGVGGKARLFWSGGEISYYGVADPLEEACVIGGATSVGNYALFVGGAYQSKADSSKSCAYSTSLTRQSIENAYNSGIERGAARAGNYAIFAGGIANNFTDSIHDDITAYDSSLSRMAYIQGYNKEAWYGLSGCSIGNYAIFSGGKYKWSESSSSSYYGTNAFAISSSLVITPSIGFKGGNASAVAGEYAIYLGGLVSSSHYKSDINAVNDSLTVITLTETISAGRNNIGAASAGDYAIFAGGTGPDSGFSINDDSSGYRNEVEVINKSLTKSIASPLTVSRSNMGAATLGDFALFAGGQTATRSVTNVVEVYDSSLTLTKNTSLTSSRRYIASTTLGDFALFAGGEIPYSTNYDTVNVYTV